MDKLTMGKDKLVGKRKRGVASLYIVIFATILFGVVTLSFIRIVTREAGQSSNDDLSRSAYDSAIAGVEDAKTAINRYYSCLGSGLSASACGRSTLFSENCDETSGIGLAQYLYGSAYSGGEVLIQENSLSTDADNNSDQAYTCVIIKDEVPDYRGNLTADTRTKVIPLRINNQNVDPATTKTIKRVRFQWYSILNENSDATGRFNTSGSGFPTADHPIIPPVIQLTYIRVGENIKPSQFHTSNSEGYDYSTFALRPSGMYMTDSMPINTIWYSDLRNAGNVSAGENNPVPVNCSTMGDFACTVDLKDLTINPKDNAFLVASLPYKDTISDFAVTLYYDNNDNSVEMFRGVQISVDSTGRTNQLVRRVETRLDPADLFFPYPQYAIEASGEGESDPIKKNFWITANCWYAQPMASVAQNCSVQNGDVPASSLVWDWW